MPSPSLLDFDELLQPIAGDSPAGTSVPYTLRQQLEDARKEDRPEDYEPGDPRRPEQPKNADWQGIVRMTTDALKNTSKDLMLVSRLTEAMVHLHGFAGLRDSLHLFNRLVTEAWDRILPSIEDGDLEVRAAPFNWLDDADRGARFPSTLRQVPIVFLDDRGLSPFDWRMIQDGKGKVTKEDFEKAVGQLSREACQTQMDDLTQSRQELTQLKTKLEEQLKNNAPGFSYFQPSLEDAAQLVGMILKRKGPAPTDAVSADDGEAAVAEAGDGSAPASTRSRGQTRDSLYQQLQVVAAQLQQMEPHSPIPYLIQKAVELGSLPFPALMRALILDENVIVQMNRELGIREQPPPAAG